MTIEAIKAILAILIGLILTIGILSPIPQVNLFLKNHLKYTTLLAVCFFVFTVGLAWLQFQKDTNTIPELTLTPLPYHRGYALPTLDPTSPEPRFLNSLPDARFLNESQRIEMWALNSSELKELIAKFGVIRVHCIRGEAIGCRVQARVNVIEQLGKQQNAHWLDCGYFNWFSMATKTELNRNINIDKKGFGFETYLTNTIEDIHFNEEKDLLLFYMIKDVQTVFLCTDTNEPIAIALDGQPAKFEVELSATAQKYPKTVFRYLVTVKWDDFQIQPV